MKLNPICMACQLRKQEAKIRHFDDEARKKQYIEQVRHRSEEVLLRILGCSKRGFQQDQQRVQSADAGYGR